MVTRAAAVTPLVNVQIPRPTEDPSVNAMAALEIARNLKILTREDYQAAARALADVKGRMGALEKARKAIKEPLDQAVKAVQALFRAPTDYLAEAERMIKRKLADYDAEQQRIANEQQRRLNEQAERDRVKLQERAAKVAEKNPERAAQLLEKAQAVSAPIVQHEAPQVAGLAMRDVPVYEITDASKLPREYLMADEKKIGGVVRSMGMQANIPGVTVRMERQVASRSS